MFWRRMVGYTLGLSFGICFIPRKGFVATRFINQLLYQTINSTDLLRDYSLPFSVAMPSAATLIPFSPPTLVEPSLPLVMPRFPPRFCAFPSLPRVIPASSENRSDSSVAFTPFDFSPAAAGFSPLAAAASASASARAASPSARPGWDSVPSPPEDAGLGAALSFAALGALLSFAAAGSALVVPFPAAAAPTSVAPPFPAFGSAPAVDVPLFLPPSLRPLPLIPPSGPPSVRPPMVSARLLRAGV